ncbi:MAG: hypothetical protein R6W78_17065 [Bacteroidales bacterium]
MKKKLFLLTVNLIFICNLLFSQSKITSEFRYEYEFEFIGFNKSKDSLFKTWLVFDLEPFNKIKSIQAVYNLSDEEAKIKIDKKSINISKPLITNRKIKIELKNEPLVQIIGIEIIDVNNKKGKAKLINQPGIHTDDDSVINEWKSLQLKQEGFKK